MEHRVEDYAKQPIDEIAKKYKQDLDDLKNTTVRCGIIGRSGVGKSSTINAIVGKKIANAGSTEQTMEEQEYQHGNIIFVDLPGCGTETFPRNKYIEKFKLFEQDKYDCFIIITDDRVYEDDVYLYKKIKNEKYPCFFARNKIDNAIENEKYDNDLSEEEAVHKIRDYITEKLNTRDMVYLISAREPQAWDFPQLLNDITNSFSDIKRKTIIRGLNGLTEEILDEKRKLGIEIAEKRALIAAANALNPIPGLDVSVDIGILYNLSKEIIEIFGLDEEHLKQLEKNTNTSYSGIKQSVLKFAAQYGTTQAIMQILKRYATTGTIKEFGKYIPIIGQAISAGLGYKMTVWFAEDLLDNAIKLSREILKTTTKQT